MTCACFDTMLTNDRGACFGNGEHGAERTHRYSFWSFWDRTKPTLGVIMLNPSTADESAFDPTLTRVMGYAKHPEWDFGGIVTGNAFALRSTDWKGLLPNPARSVGRENDDHLVGIMHVADRLVVGWGAHIGHTRLAFRIPKLRQIIGNNEAHTWKLTAHGHPSHPLYLASEQKISLYEFPK